MSEFLDSLGISTEYWSPSLIIVSALGLVVVLVMAVYLVVTSIKSTRITKRQKGGQSGKK